MGQNTKIFIWTVLFILFFITTIISASKHNINIKTGGGTGNISYKVNNKNISKNKLDIVNNKTHTNDTNKKDNDTPQATYSIIKENKKQNDYFFIAMVCLLLATSISIILILFLIFFLIFKYKNKYKIIQR